MNKVSLADGINWVGVVDWNLRDFHGYVTRRGATYNAYLIQDEKTALVDTVKYMFSNELLRNICENVDPAQIDYIIINHLEKDHSSSLPIIAKYAKNATIIASPRGKDAIIEHYGADFCIETVKTGDELKLGKRTLRFIEAPMVHWPDSMFTYVVEDKILMPNDAFGQHFATSERFNDQVDEHVLMEEAKKYYANILMPLAPIITRKLEEVTKMGIPIDMIAPSHGLIWRSDPSKIIRAYLDWSADTSVNKVIIVYDTMWGSTEMMAHAITEGVVSQNIDVKLMKLRVADTSDIITEILDAKAIVVGSPTLHNGMFPTIGGFLTHITGLKPKGKLWSFFGSYGWGGGAVNNMIEMVKKAGFNIYEPNIQVKFVPDQEDLKKCFEFGQQIAAKIKA
jgi:anaerobic nitric oxide reductase flavorubredoxin